jgi:hypothetical protein
MAIPDGTKFHGVAPFVDTKNKGSEQANAMRDAYTIEQIASKVVFGPTAIIEPEFITATPGGSLVVATTKNIIDLTWVGGSGTFDLILPSATEIPYRFLRIVNDATVVASDKVHVVAPGSETIDGTAFYVINKPYNGVAVWSDGNNWVVIQAKQ